MFGEEKKSFNDALAELTKAAKGMDMVAVSAATKKMYDLMETGDDFLKDLDVVVEAVPKDWKMLVQTILGALDHTIRVGTRASNTLQEVERTSAALRGLIETLVANGVELRLKTSPTVYSTNLKT